MSKVKPTRSATDPTGYLGPLRFTEVMLGGKHRPGSGLWAEVGELTAIIHDAAFVTGAPLKDSHGQIAHYASSFELFDKKNPDRRAELSERLDQIPQLADFHIDIDNDGDLELSRQQAIKLVEHYLSLGVPEPAIGIRFSGKKGFDVMLPWQVFGVRAQGIMGLNWTTWKLLGQQLTAELGLEGVDAGLWRKNGTIRLENTRHPSSGLLKVRLTPEELRSGVDQILRLAEKPRRDLYDEATYLDALGVVPGLRALYLPLQAEADTTLATARALAQRPLEPAVMAEIGEGLVPCLVNLTTSPPQRGNRNETTFHLGMMAKYTGRPEAQARELARAWLGSAYHDVGAEGTIASAYRGPFAGGCRWMRDAGHATARDCAACPVGQRRMVRDAREDREAEPEVVIEQSLPSIEQQRQQLKEDFKQLDEHLVTLVRVPAGVGKSYVALQRTVELVAEGKRVLWFVRDTRKADGLAADLIDELRETHGYHGKVQLLLGRDQDNCEDWENAQRVAKRGYSVGRALCNGCFARSYCGYYRQYDEAYEPGVYIASHAMLPLLFDDERRGFSREFVGYRSEEGGGVVGGPLALIVIDEDALDVFVERYTVGTYHLQNELKYRTRSVKTFDRLTGQMVARDVKLDPMWLKVVEWLQAAVRVRGATLPALASVAHADGHDIERALQVIDPAKVIDADFKRHRGHKPFTTRLYLALLREVRRLKDGNYTIWNTDIGLEILSLRGVQFPSGVPVAVLDAYADLDLYQHYYRAAGVNRLMTLRDYPVREQANTTYVLGANLLASDFARAEQGNRHAIAKIERVMRALQVLTEDGIETYVVAKRSFFESRIWQEWAPKLPNCVAEGEAGMLYFWRGRGINAAAGKRIAVVQVPNFHPDAILAEASVLFADEPRLDDQRVRVEAPVVWAADAENKRAITVDTLLYADDRLNLINERYRMDELVQMALRSRSLTTGAEIIIFADLPDPRLPARRVVSVAELAGDAEDQQARQAVYQALLELDALDAQALVNLGIAQGDAQPTPLRQAVKRLVPAELNLARRNPVPLELARREAGL